MSTYRGKKKTLTVVSRASPASPEKTASSRSFIEADLWIISPNKLFVQPNLSGDGNVNERL